MDAAVKSDREWIAQAVAALDTEHRREIDTPLLKLDLPEIPGCDIYLKDETAHPSASIKHRLARSLFLHAICNGDVKDGTTVVEASSGSTAISEAYFANLLALRFIAVVPRGTASAKLKAIEQSGAQIHLIAAQENASAVAARIAHDTGGYFMDQFTFAERVTDWRGNNNLAESLFAQMSYERYRIPAWIVIGAGTGGTGATIGRYIRYRPELCATRLCVVGDNAGTGDVIEGIGAGIEPSFMRNLADRSFALPDAASIAGAHWLEHRLARRFGPSTGANIVGALILAAQMHAQGLRGSIATLACDAGDRYADTVYDAAWLAAREIDIVPWQQKLAQLPGNALHLADDLQRAGARGVFGEYE